MSVTKLSEKEAVIRGLKLCGFMDAHVSYVHEYQNQVYIPDHQTESFDKAIEYMDYYTFNRIPTKEERLVFYRTAQRLRRYKEIYNESVPLKI